jgi:hypothetical protein
MASTFSSQILAFRSLILKSNIFHLNLTLLLKFNNGLIKIKSKSN